MKLNWLLCVLFMAAMSGCGGPDSSWTPQQKAEYELGKQWGSEHCKVWNMKPGSPMDQGYRDGAAWGPFQPRRDWRGDKVD